MRFVAPPGMTLPEEREGRKSIGRYEIIKTLGRGAMGVVYKARDPLLDRIVAVKTIVSPQGVGRRVRSAYLERFEREAKAAAKMQHPAIVTIFDVGVDEELGAPFMVLEYLPGESLADRLDRVRMPLGKGVNIAMDLGSALAFAHRQRIVHRDVKPANVLHAGENRWKLADFGIARLPDSDLTQVGIFMGTPGYSPPEAIREGRYTPQADVFAWGAVLYELLSGRIPYEGPDTRTTNSYVVKGEASPPTKHDSSIPEPLSQVAMMALHPSAAERYKDGADAEAALRKAWDYCLTQNLVLPSSLIGEEVAHERVGAQMHARVTNPSAAPHDPRGFVIEARPGEKVSDDDPTRILVRDRDGIGADTERDDGGDRTMDMRNAAKRSGGGSGRSASRDPGGATRPLSDQADRRGDGRDKKIGRPEQTPVVGRGAGASTSSTAAGGMPRWVWLIIALVAVAGGGAAAWILLKAL
jgi:serine/threonine protein kinase